MNRIGAYEVREELGRGAAGTVYRAYDPRLKREVAIKVLQPAASASSLQRFEREANTLARLRQRNILPIHEVGLLDGGRPYLVVPLARTSLKDLLDRGGPLEPEQALAHVAKVARALEHAHQVGVLHRDVKPGNVLLLDGEPLLADFGLTKDLHAPDDHLSQTGALQGSPGYWSPEQASGQKHALGPATDVYSLGATLYALLTGVPPCWGDTLTQVAEATLAQRPIRPSRLRPGIPRAVEAIVLRCLEKSPGDRPPSAGALARELERVLAGDPGAATPGWLLPALGAGVVAVALGVGAWVVLAPSAPEANPEVATGPRTAARPRTDWVATATEQLLSADYDGCAESLARALEGDPRSVSAYALSGQRWLDLDDPRRALADAERALELDPSASLALALRGDVHLAQGELRAALELAERLVRDAPQRAEGYRLRSRAQGRLKHAPEALADAERAQDLNPRAVLNVLAVAEAQLQGLDAQASLAATRHALSLVPGFPRALALKVRAHLLTQDTKAALAVADENVALHPKLPAAYLLRSLVRQQRGEVEPALRDVNAALELAPNSARIHAGRAAIAWARQDFEAALPDFDRALELAPGLGEVRLNRALLYVNRQDFAAALSDYDRLLRDDPDQPLLYSLRAAARVGVGDHEGATADYYTHIRHNPNDARAWETLGVLQTFRGSKHEALAAYDRALDLDPRASTFANRASLKRSLGDVAGAREDLRRALELDPDDAGAQGLLEQLGPE
ncbi:MAG: protein kinase [Planctomycetes bacterium]|nr:protein kinase [Planctomycetota bacterium]